jgi:uncharacterized protein DUF4325
MFAIMQCYVYNNPKENKGTNCMARPTNRGDQIKKFILKKIPKHPADVVSVASNKFGITRQAINRYIRDLIKDKLIVAEGKTRQRKYKVNVLYEETFVFKLDGLQEHVIWNDVISPLLQDYSENVLDLWHYGTTEMINNAVDHSEGSELTIYVEKDAVKTKIWIEDNGIGIFKKIKEACELEDERHAVLELSKGKLTTDPDNHTGEGIFFSSRSFDSYNIFSGDVFFDHDNDYNEEEDWIFEREKPFNGTQIFMCLENESDRDLKTIFDKFTTEGDDFGFTKTVVPVRLAKHGLEKLVSRSQAKRLMSRVDRFKTVILNFKGVEVIGQAFADEIFRVFVKNHPDIEVTPMFASEEIKNMIKRAESSS